MATETLLEAEEHLSRAEYHLLEALKRLAELRVYREYLDDLRRARRLVNIVRLRIPDTIIAA